MTSEVVKDIGVIYTRLFDHRAFSNGEIKYFLNEFEERREDREIDNLFTTLKNITEVKDSDINRCCLLGESNLPNLTKQLNLTLNICENILNKNVDNKLEEKLERNRIERKEVWQQFIDDMQHKCSRIDITFEEKEEELRDFYIDLERKLHINK